MNDAVIQAALRYIDGRLSVIPVRADGTKAPALDSWKPFMRDRATPEQVRAWYAGPEVRGVAILGGIASGGLEVLDVDDLDAWHAWRSLALSLLHEAGEKLPPLPMVRTPSNGRHLSYRHTGEQEGSQKLARGLRGGVVKTLIETRGCNGYVLAPGCPPACHPSGRTYDVLQGDPADVPTITPAQRALLLDAARACSEVTEPEQVSAPRPRVADGTRPGDVYMQRASWDALLRRHGWHKVAQHGATGLWRRPGKKRGISATTNYGGSGYLIVFSTNAPPFDADRGYSLFSAYGLLDHAGDFHAAAQALADAGYAAPQTTTLPTPAQERATSRTTDDLLRRRLAASVR